MLAALQPLEPVMRCDARGSYVRLAGKPCGLITALAGIRLGSACHQWPCFHISPALASLRVHSAVSGIKRHLRTWPPLPPLTEWRPPSCTPSRCVAGNYVQAILAALHDTDEPKAQTAQVAGDKDLA